MSLAFLTKGVITGDSQSDKDHKKNDEILTALPPHQQQQQQHQQQRADDTASTTASTHSRSRSKDTSRTRLSLSFLRPSSPLEALPDFASSGDNVSAVSRAASQKSGRPETGKSEKSHDGGASGSGRKGSVKKRLSFMSISKKRSESSVKGRVGEVLVEE